MNDINKKNIPTPEEVFEVLLPLMEKYALKAIACCVATNDYKAQLYTFDQFDKSIPPDLSANVYINLLEASLSQIKGLGMTHENRYELYSEEVKN